MPWNIHSGLEGTHAFLSPSTYAWLNYDDDKIIEAYRRHRAKVRGTLMHDLAKTCIRAGIPIGDINSEDLGIKTLGMYVHDCRIQRMDTEVVLFYSMNAYGTADAIRFDEENRRLYIFDLKTGVTATSFRQLEIYAAYFCLEYHVPVDSITYELRIYQNGDVRFERPDPSVIERIIGIVQRFDERITKLQKERGLNNV